MVTDIDSFQYTTPHIRLIIAVLLFNKCDFSILLQLILINGN